MRFFKPTPPSSGGMQSLTGTHAAGFSSRFAATFRPLLALALFLASGFLNAQETPVGKVQRIETRENVTVPVYAVWREDAVLTVVLFSGGGGGYGKIGDDGWPESGNFLIRTGKQWASHPFNILMVGRPSDGLDLSLGNGRIDAKHTADTFAILKAVKAQSKAPIWLIGTSMGTISVTAAGIEDSENLVAGVVLTSSIVGRKIPGAVPLQRLEKIRVPTLIVHHEADGCAFCRPDEAAQIANALRQAPIKQTRMLSGGSGATGNPCQAMHYHGFIGMEKEAVDLIAAWISNPAE